MSTYQYDVQFKRRHRQLVKQLGEIAYGGNADKALAAVIESGLRMEAAKNPALQPLVSVLDLQIAADRREQNPPPAPPHSING